MMTPFPFFFSPFFPKRSPALLNPSSDVFCSRYPVQVTQASTASSRPAACTTTCELIVEVNRPTIDEISQLTERCDASESGSSIVVDTFRRRSPVEEKYTVPYEERLSGSAKLFLSSLSSNSSASRMFLMRGFIQAVADMSHP